MELSYSLGTTRRVPQENFSESHIINRLLTKSFIDGWILASIFFFDFMDLEFDSFSVHINTQTKNLALANIMSSHPGLTLGQQPIRFVPDWKNAQGWEGTYIKGGTHGLTHRRLACRGGA